VLTLDVNVQCQKQIEEHLEEGSRQVVSAYLIVAEKELVTLHEYLRMKEGQYASFKG
jgi:hypothetical protein